MGNYIIQGPKAHEFKKYQTINFIEKYAKELDNETIGNYNQALAIVQKWMILAIDARKRDVAHRLNETKKKREDREDKIEQEKERQDKRNEALTAAAEKHNDENADESQRYNDMMAAKEAGEEYEVEEGESMPTKEYLFDEKYFLF